MTAKHSNETRPDIEFVRECVSYDQISGSLTWRHRPFEHFADARSAASWNTRFSGKQVKKRSNGYVIVVITVDGKEHFCSGHRVAWALKTGAWPEHEVDHENRVRDDNRWVNLRDATHQQNQWNRGLCSRNRSGFKGVHWHAKTGRWRAQIKGQDGKVMSLGLFDSPEKGGAAYQSAEAAMRGQFAGSGGTQNLQ